MMSGAGDTTYAELLPPTDNVLAGDGVTLTEEEIQQLAVPTEVLLRGGQTSQTKKKGLKRKTGDEAFAELCEKHIEKMQQGEPKKQDEEEKFASFLAVKLREVPKEKKYAAELALLNALQPFLQ